MCEYCEKIGKVMDLLVEKGTRAKTTKELDEILTDHARLMISIFKSEDEFIYCYAMKFIAAINAIDDNATPEEVKSVVLTHFRYFARCIRVAIEEAAKQKVAGSKG